jgi:hypothetical protein
MSHFSLGFAYETVDKMSHMCRLYRPDNRE